MDNEELKIRFAIVGEQSNNIPIHCGEIAFLYWIIGSFPQSTGSAIIWAIGVVVFLTLGLFTALLSHSKVSQLEKKLEILEGRKTGDS